MTVTTLPWRTRRRILLAWIRCADLINPCGRFAPVRDWHHSLPLEWFFNPADSAAIRARRALDDDVEASK